MKGYKNFHKGTLYISYIGYIDNIYIYDTVQACVSMFHAGHVLLVHAVRETYSANSFFFFKSHTSSVIYLTQYNLLIIFGSILVMHLIICVRMCEPQ